MSEEITLKQQIENFVSGKYNSPDRKTQIDAGWYDWFCKDTSLKNKTEKLYKKILSIMKVTDKINTETSYMFMKNNCPYSKPLYDSFSICDLKTEKVLFYVAPHSPYEKAAVVYAAPEFETPAVCGTWKDVLNYFKSL